MTRWKWLSVGAAIATALVVVQTSRATEAGPAEPLPEEQGQGQQKQEAAGGSVGLTVHTTLNGCFLMRASKDDKKPVKVAMFERKIDYEDGQKRSQLWLVRVGKMKENVYESFHFMPADGDTCGTMAKNTDVKRFETDQDFMNFNGQKICFGEWSDKNKRWEKQGAPVDDVASLVLRGKPKPESGLRTVFKNEDGTYGAKVARVSYAMEQVNCTPWSLSAPKSTLAP
jgi:hypothetical protein